MAEIAETTVRATDRLALRAPRRKWSRPSSVLAVAALSLLGWLAIGSLFRYFLIL